MQTREVICRRLVELLGAAVMLASLLFVGYRIWTLGVAELGSALWSHAGLTVLWSVAYAGALLAIAVAWHALIRLGSGKSSPAAIDNLGAFVFTQINKYLPGNVFHLVSRYTVMLRLGADHSTIAWSTTAELVLTPCAALSIVAVGEPQLIGRYLPTAALPSVVAAATAALVLLAAGLYLFRTQEMRIAAPFDLRRMALGAAAAFLLYALFFVASGALLFAIFTAFDPGKAFDVRSVMAAAAGAWALGFLMPGSPAGIGVREAALILLLAPLADPQIAATAVVAYRIVTVIGDVLLFCIGGAWAYRAHKRLLVRTSSAEWRARRGSNPRPFD